MKAPTRKLLSKLEPERVEEKRFVLGERRLFLAQICAESEMEATARTSSLKRKTEWVQSKLFNSGNEARKKRRLTETTQNLIQAQENSKRKLVRKLKSVWLERPTNMVDGAVKKERFTETQNQSEKKTRNTCGLTKKPEVIEKRNTLVDGRVKKERPTENQMSAQGKPETKLALTMKSVQIEKPMTITEVPARTLGLKRKTEWVQSKPLNSGNEAQKKRRLTKIIADLTPVALLDGAVRNGGFTETRNQPEKQIRSTCLTKKPEGVEKPTTLDDEVLKKDRLTEKLILAREKSERKPGLAKETVWVKKPATLADGNVKQGRFTVTRNQQQNNLNAEISLNRTEEGEEKKRALCGWKRIKAEREIQRLKERQKQREAVRLALDQMNNTCGFEDNMDSMRDFQKITGCSSNFYIFSRDRNLYDKL